MASSLPLRLPNYQINHSFKKIGVGAVILCFLILLINKISIGEEIISSLSKYGLLISLVIISISKEKIEDEMITLIRAHSYAIGFMSAVFFSIVMPLVDYLLEYFLEKEEALFQEMGDFQILWLLLSIQVFSFEILKRKNN